MPVPFGFNGKIYALISCYACKTILSDQGYEVTYPDGYIYTVCENCRGETI